MNIQPISGFITMGYHLTAIKYRDTQMKGITKHERSGSTTAKYITLQAEHIKERIGQFGGKLYLEFGGKLFDDYHASRVLPGFEPDSKIRMLKSLSEDVEVVIAINANHIESDKVRGDLGITYDEDVLRLMDVFAGRAFMLAA